MFVWKFFFFYCIFVYICLVFFFGFDGIGWILILIDCFIFLYKGLKLFVEDFSDGFFFNLGFVLGLRRVFLILCGDFCLFILMLCFWLGCFFIILVIKCFFFCCLY